jgi:predicted GNAT family N-acyltransferase
MDNIEYRIEIFSTKYNREKFNCNSARLNTYLQEQVTSNIRQNITICYLALIKQEIIGYYTLSSSSLLLNNLSDDLKNKLPRYPTIPAVLMGRLAVDTNYQGKKVGASLLADALAKCINSGIGAYALIVDVLDDKAKNFYLNYGFVECIDNPQILYFILSNVKNYLKK